MKQFCSKLSILKNMKKQAPKIRERRQGFLVMFLKIILVFFLYFRCKRCNLYWINVEKISSNCIAFMQWSSWQLIPQSLIKILSINIYPEMCDINSSCPDFINICFINTKKYKKKIKKNQYLIELLTLFHF